MPLLLDSFWRAAAYCLHPRVIVLSLIPLVLLVTLALGFGYLFWESAIDAINAWLAANAFDGTLWRWLSDMGAGGLKSVLAPLIVIFAVTPVLVALSLVLVAVLMVPALVQMVATRRFADLERRQGGSVLLGFVWALLSAAVAGLALVVSIPLWFVPPLVLILPPLIWGWLTYRVMVYDALAEHASSDERRALVKQHRLVLIGMGVLTGLMGAAPSVVWASGVLFATLFVVLVPVAIWIYTLIFAFAALWFIHYCLAALQALRAAQTPPPPAVLAPATSAPALPSPPLNSGPSVGGV